MSYDSNITQYVVPSERVALEPYVNPTLCSYLSEVKSLIDVHQGCWDRAKKLTNPYEYIHTAAPGTKTAICRRKPVSRSFYKMIEIFHMNSIGSCLGEGGRVFYLAEGPGGFIEAVIWMRQRRDEHVAITLLDESDPSVPGWKRTSGNWEHNGRVKLEQGPDGRGDITDVNTFDELVRKYGGTCELVTGDGGFNFSGNFNAQEAASAALAFSQVATTLGLQAVGGTSIIKFFDTFTLLSAELVWLMATLYDTVSWTKPCTSRYANSEKYMVCKGYRRATPASLLGRLRGVMSEFSEGANITSFLNISIPRLMTSRMEEINAVLGQQQIESIMATLSVIRKDRMDRGDTMKKNNIAKCIAWCQRHGLPHTRPLAKKGPSVDENLCQKTG